jgi:hypothetical protein
VSARRLTERELAASSTRLRGHGGTTLIHYIGVTSMAAPALRVPRQFHPRRRVSAGDAMFVEISANFFHDYPGQVLRTYAIEAEPTPLYRDLHATAEAAFDAISGCLRAGATAAEIPPRAGRAGGVRYAMTSSTAGGGYWQPIIGRESPGRTAARLARSEHDDRRAAERGHARR